MIKTRYFVEHLPSCRCAGTGRAFAEAAHCQCQHRTAAHNYARVQHWIRVDDSTVVGVAEFKSSHHLQVATNHARLTVLPHLYSSKSVKQVLSEKSSTQIAFAKKFASLQSLFDLDDADTTADFIGKIVSEGHVFLSPDA